MDSSSSAVVSVAEPPGATPPWPRWQRIAFRFLLVYYVLQAFPGPLDNLLYTTSGVIREVAVLSLGDEAYTLLAKSPLRWPAKWGYELSKVGRGHQAATTWLDEHGLAPYEVIHQVTGSGDTAHGITLCLANLVVAALLAGIWSLLRRRPCSYSGAGRWLHLVVRFDLAFWMLSYGSFKLYGSQFGELGLARLTQEVGDLWPMTMVGTFMQASPAYETLGGLGEVLGGLLLFHRRTALLGALVTLVVMGNVCALNWLCGVPVKLLSLHLWLYALFLLSPWRHSLAALFVHNGATQPADLQVPVWRWLRWPARIGGWSWVLATLVLLHLQHVRPNPRMQGREKSELYGVWLVERMIVDEVEVPASDATRWRFLAIDRGKLAWARDATGARQNFEFVWDAEAGVAQVKPLQRDDQSDAAPWKIAQGTKLVPVDPPLVLRNEDRGKQIDGERRSLVVTGAWGDKQLELHVVKKLFRLQTSFRLRQELPDRW